MYDILPTEIALKQKNGPDGGFSGGFSGKRTLPAVRQYLLPFPSS
jgi:hypothetical protein